jgi:hypothetical protein
MDKYLFSWMKRTSLPNGLQGLKSSLKEGAKQSGEHTRPRWPHLCLSSTSYRIWGSHRRGRRWRHARARVLPEPKPSLRYARIREETAPAVSGFLSVCSAGSFVRRRDTSKIKNQRALLRLKNEPPCQTRAALIKTIAHLPYGQPRMCVRVAKAFPYQFERGGNLRLSPGIPHQLFELSGQFNGNHHRFP